MNSGSRRRERIVGTSLSDPSGNWHVPYAFACTHQGDTSELQWWRMWQRLSRQTVSDTVLLVPTDARMAFPEPLPSVPGIFGRHTGENGLYSRVYHRNLLIRPLQVDDAPHLAIAYEGAPLHQNESLSLLTVLGLVLGQDLNVRAEISVDAEGNAVERTLFAVRDSPLGDNRPAIDAFDASSVRAVGSDLARMVERARRLRFEDDVALDVAIKYLQRWNMNQLDLEIRDITSALNVLIESPAFAPTRTTLLSANVLKKVYRAVDAVLDADSNVLHSDFRDRIRKRLWEANSISISERRNHFWETVGFQPTAQERSALERRHVISHKGYIDPRDRAEERALLEDIDLARTIVNEALLALLHYDGPLIDYRTGVRRMRARSADATASGDNSSNSEGTCDTN
jgi:hypothetical protein